MSVTERDISRKVQQWLDYADEDLVLARHALTLKSTVPYRLIAYHAQQCAEKHLKAYLVFRQVDFPFTHNLARLVEIAEGLRSWSDTFRDAEELTPFAVTTRYPGEDEPVSGEEARRAIAIAEQTKQIIRDVLTKEGFFRNGLRQ